MNHEMAHYPPALPHKQVALNGACTEKGIIQRGTIDRQHKVATTEREKMLQGPTKLLLARCGAEDPSV